MKYGNRVSFRSDEYMFSYARVDQLELNMHLHNMYELLWLLEGDTSYIEGDKSYRLAKGDFVLTPPRELHTMAFHSDAPYERMFFQFSHDFAEHIDTRLIAPIEKHSGGLIIRAETAARLGLCENMLAVMESTKKQGKFCSADVRAHLTFILIALNEWLSEKETAEKAAKHDRIDEIASYLSENPSVSLDELSKRFFINKYHLCHAFKSKLGITVKEFVNLRRISKAKQLIDDGYAITELCFLCGFNDYTTFYKTFKRLTGKSPSEFFTAVRQSQ